MTQREILVRVVDDDDLMRQSWAFLLESQGWHVKTYPDALSFLEDDDPAVAGCLLLDVRLPKLSGLELQELMLHRSMELPIVFISAHGDIEMAVHALKRGACDFLTKPVSNDKLSQAISLAVSKNLQYWDQVESIADDRKRLELLSSREKDVAQQMALGLLNKQIADRLGISEKTVQIHRCAIYRKLGLRNAVEVSDLLTRLGLKSPAAVS